MAVIIHCMGPCGKQMKLLEPHIIQGDKYLCVTCGNKPEEFISEVQAMNRMLRMPIHTEVKFLATFKVGDTFWHIESMSGRPRGIKEEILYAYADYEFNFHKIYKLAILSPEAAAIVALNPTKVYSPSSNHAPYPYQFVSDLVNQSHGAFTCKADAEAEMARRIANP